MYIYMINVFVSGHLVRWRFGFRDSGFESCIQQRKTTCLLSIRKSFACVKASKLTTYISYMALIYWYNIIFSKSHTCTHIVQSDHNEFYDDVIKWKHFPRYWPFVRGIHRSPVNSALKDQWRRALIFSWICAWINGWVNNREAGDLRRHITHYNVIIML